jgi:DNA-binding NtrC family response regulator
MQTRPRRALIVTDVHLVAWALSSAFGQAGFVALTADTVGAACDVLRTVDDLDLVVTSLSIGQARVSEVLAAISAERPGTPAILLAAEPDASFPLADQTTVLLQLPFSVDDVVGAAAELTGDESGPAVAATPASSASRPWD